MEHERINDMLDGLIEKLAAVEHERWSHWQRYVHSKCIRQPDGSLLIPAEFVARWEKQIATKYGELDDKKRESDREQVRKYLPLIASALRRSANLTSEVLPVPRPS
jgi:hypothetical protein